LIALGKIKILHPQKHPLFLGIKISIIFYLDYGIVQCRRQTRWSDWAISQKEGSLKSPPIFLIRIDFLWARKLERFFVAVQ